MTLKHVLITTEDRKIIKNTTKKLNVGKSWNREKSLLNQAVIFDI